MLLSQFLDRQSLVSLVCQLFAEFAFVFSSSFDAAVFWRMCRGNLHQLGRELAGNYHSMRNSHLLTVHHDYSIVDYTEHMDKKLAYIAQEFDFGCHSVAYSVEQKALELVQLSMVAVETAVIATEIAH